MDSKDSTPDPSYTLQAEQSSDGFLRIISNHGVQNNERLLTLAEKGDIKGVEGILSAGAVDNDHRGLGGANALHYACRRGHAAVVSALLKADFYINARNDSGESPLHLAVYDGHLLIVEQLIDKGADINATNNYHETPLIYAAQKSFPALVRMLLTRGADPDVEDRYGDKAVDHASDARTAAMFTKVQKIWPDAPWYVGNGIAQQSANRCGRASGCGVGSCNCRVLSALAPVPRPPSDPKPPPGIEVSRGHRQRD